MDKSRTEILIGKDGTGKLAQKHVTVVGTGGVGGYVTIMLARAGIEKFTLIDFDDVSPSNINRQIVAYNSTIGRKKVEVLKEMLLDINESITVETKAERLTKENISSLIGQTDIVIDAIDSVKDKIELIAYCKNTGIYIISAMGAGNRFDYPSFKLIDIFSTSDDGLAKAVRKGLREKGVKSLDVVISLSKGAKVDGIIGSISYYPAAMGCYITSVVLNKIIKEEI